MRPQQWYKNLILFLGIIFSGNFLNPGLWGTLLLAFSVFCLLSGSLYIFNDVKDIERDRLHPKKRYRPIAAGDLSPSLAIPTAVVLIIGAIVAGFVINPTFGALCLAYLLISSSYTAYLKNYAIVDAIVIGVGFVIRAAAGCAAIDVVISPWLILCVFLIALVLTFGKRRQELLTANDSRACLAEYSVPMSENFLNLSVSLLLMSYALYSVSVNESLLLTLPFALFGVFRYVQLVHLDNFGGNCEQILVDRPSIINLTLWIGLTVLILYGGGL
jgi:4-hydroxybenzoate polyprenyltransferase